MVFNAHRSVSSGGERASSIKGGPLWPPIILSVGSFLASLAVPVLLRSMSSRFEVKRFDIVPAVDETQRFVGMVERSRLTASLLIDVTKSLQK